MAIVFKSKFLNYYSFNKKKKKINNKFFFLKKKQKSECICINGYAGEDCSSSC
jgi:hypothetical protein